MLRRALDARAVELGRPYTILDLAEESGTHFTLVSKVMTGERRPTAAALEAWARPLRPHFDLDAALLAAGLPPHNTAKAGVVRRLWRLTADQWAQLEEWVGERATEHGPDDDAGDQGECGDGQDEPPPKA